MTRLAWWLGVGVLAIALLAHALIPRYEWRALPGHPTLVRVDRWTGAATLGRWDHGRWTAHDETPSRQDR